MRAGIGQPAAECADLEVTICDGDRVERWSLAGTLHPATAPALPWAPGIDAVSIAWHRRIRIHHTAGRAPPPLRWRRCTPP